MPSKKSTLILICIFSLLIFSLSFVYGPLRRVFVAPARIIQVETGPEIYRLWESSRVKGRVVVLFSRHLNVELAGNESSGIKCTEMALQHGIIRKVYHVVPDHVWPEVAKNLSTRPVFNKVEEGYVGFLEEGRAYVMPLSRFTQIQENVLLVLEPAVWGTEELQQIKRLITEKKVTTDLFAIIRGGDGGQAAFADSFHSTLN